MAIRAEQHSRIRLQPRGLSSPSGALQFVAESLAAGRARGQVGPARDCSSSLEFPPHLPSQEGSSSGVVAARLGRVKLRSGPKDSGKTPRLRERRVPRGQLSSRSRGSGRNHTVSDKREVAHCLRSYGFGLLPRRVRLVTRCLPSSRTRPKQRNSLIVCQRAGGLEKANPSRQPARGCLKCKGLPEGFRCQRYEPWPVGSRPAGLLR